MTWFSRLRNWVTDSGNGIGIRADYHDSEDDNFASGINQCLNIAGLNTPTANISMGNFKLTNAALGTSAADYARLDQAQTRVVAYAADSVGTDSYAITLSPALAAYAVGQSFFFAAGTANTGAATLNINGLGAKTIKKDYNADLNDGDIVQNQIMHVVYDGTNFQMQTPAHGQMNQSLSAIYAADGGGSDSYAISLTPAISAYATGLMVNFKANTLNTGAASLNVNSLGAKTIVKDGSLTLETGDIKASQIIQVIYDGTNFQMISPFSYGLNQTGSALYAADAGSTDDYVITLTPVPPAYVTGMCIRAKCNTANTGAATINVNSLGVKSIVKGAATALATGDIQSGQIVTLIYDGTNFQLANYIANGTVTSVATGNGLTGGAITTSGTISFASATVVQTVTTSSATTANTATTIPADTTIPQITEGVELITLAITPKSATSTLVIDFFCPLVGNAGTINNQFALFQDATANALNVGSVTPDSVARCMPFAMRHVMTSGTTSSTTFRIRFGPSSGTMHVLRSQDGSITYGGATARYTFTISEILP